MNKPVTPTYVRNPVYVFYALGAFGLFLCCALIAGRETIGPLEKTTFDLFYNLPDALRPIFRFITLFGTIGFALMMGALFFILRRRDIALRLVVAAGSAYLLAMWLKDWVVRARPQYLLDYVIPRDQAISSGFPSGHAATATAVGLTLALYAPRVWRKWILLGIGLVCISRLYLGVHLPMDVVGGYAIGLFCYSLTCLTFGSVHRPIDLKNLIAKLKASGMPGLSLKPASVDARGSVPFMGQFDGGNVFVKVYNQDNNAADWLFKLIRRISYRRLEDEIPYFTPKRAIEHEAYMTLLAGRVEGVRAPEIVGVFNVSPNAYAMATMRLDATGLNKMQADDITDTMLEDVWRQILALHKRRIIHRDLRCANVMIENSTKLPWIIDFGFAENAVDPHAFYRDNVEFIASSATIVGASRAVSIAKKALGKQGIVDALPYMQLAALSGATTESLKQQELLSSIRAEMYQAAGVKPGEVKNQKITRISRSNIFQLSVLLLLGFILIPQLSSLKESIEVLKTTDLLIYVGALLLSVLTYVWAATSYKILSDIPITLRKLFVVEWAGSFANRLLPAGLGSLGFNTMFMMKNGHSEGKAGTIAGVNNLLGVISSVILMTVAVLVWSSSLDLGDELNISARQVMVVGIIVLTAVIGVRILYKRLNKVRNKIDIWYTQSKQALKKYANQPVVLFSALGAQLLITLTYTLVMVVSAKSLSVNLTYAQALLAVTFGSLIGSITPTPGGIGGAEAGIVAALTLVGLPMEVAIAIAVLYRLATFWLTIPPGYFAYRYSFAKNYYS